MPTSSKTSPTGGLGFSTGLKYTIDKHLTVTFRQVKRQRNTRMCAMICILNHRGLGAVGSDVGQIRSYSTPGPVSTGTGDCIWVQLPAPEIYLSLTNHPGKLSLAIPSWLGAMSTGQRAVKLCDWE